MTRNQWRRVSRCWQCDETSADPTVRAGLSCDVCWDHAAETRRVHWDALPLPPAHPGNRGAFVCVYVPDPGPVFTALSRVDVTPTTP